MSEHTSHHEEHEHHLSPLDLFWKIFGALIVLTILTVVTSYFDFGIMNIVVAMVIAVIKASLVILFFMQLKFDDIGNKVTFAAAFAFLAVFILLTGSDLFFRHNPEPLKVDTAVAAAATGETDQNKLRMPSAELVAKGKDLFKTNACYTCHGETGRGDGIAAGALNPKPRDFTSGYWKFGGSPTRVFHTITVGSPGTGMAPYGHLSVADRYALSHYVRSFHSPQPDDTDADLKAAGLSGGGKGATEAKEGPSIPVEVAMDKMEEPDQVEMPAGAMKDAHSPGAKIYQAQCLKCHGVNGVGARTMAIGVNPPVTLMTAPFRGSHASWVNNASDFEQIVVKGYPGRGMPGFADFSKTELAELHTYLRELTAK